ncbi:MAG: hypothetical protein R2828_29465 [Saprospiraceae bacterium]
MASQGETLLLLVRRSGKEAKQVAEEMGYNPIYLSRLFKKEKLPASAKEKAIEVFGLPLDYFENDKNGSGASDHPSQEKEKDKEIERLKDKIKEQQERINKLIDIAYKNTKEKE